MSNHEELIATFTSITGLENRERVEFYLEAAGWELEPALSSYFEAGDEGGQEDAAAVAMGNQPPQLPQQQQQKPPATAQQPAARTTGGIATLDTLRRQQQQQEDDEDNSDDDKQAFYAGGSQNSGQQVLGPGSGREELVKDMFKRAREHGAEEVPAPPQHHQQLRRPAAAAGGSFSGAGYTLEGGQQPPSNSSSEAKPPTTTTTVVLRLWSTGFTLNEGPLRDYHDEGSRAFLDSVRRGEIPPELLSQHPGNEIDLTMEDRHHEEYKPPKPISKPFQGVGNVLATPSVASTTEVPSPSELIELENQARAKLVVDESQETTNVQLRLADGSRMRIRVNLSHTVEDLHLFINGARPHYATTNYVLTLFPNTVLDAATTIGGGGLKNSAIVQKMK